MAEKKKQLNFIDRMEVEGYHEEYLIDRWRIWKCEVKTEPHDNYSIDWYFWFTLPQRKNRNEEVSGKEIRLSYGHRLYVMTSEIFYDKTGEKIRIDPLGTTIENLNGMVEHTKKIQKTLKEEYK